MPVTRAPLPSSRASVRREREREIVAATRALFDQRGMQDAPIEEIARAVGINKALIYRHFASKEELYVLALTSYLTELAERLDEAPGDSRAADELETPSEPRARAGAAASNIPPTDASAAASETPPARAGAAAGNTPPARAGAAASNAPPSAASDIPSAHAGTPRGKPDAVARLERGWRCYTDFCLQHPAFVDCGLSLMRQPAADLRESVSDSIWMRLGIGMAGCLGRLSEILAQGAREGAFDVDDADFTANHLYTQTLGTMQLARVGVGVRAGRAGGVPEIFEIDPRRVQDACIADVLAAVGARR